MEPGDSVAVPGNQCSCCGRCRREGCLSQSGQLEGSLCCQPLPDSSMFWTPAGASWPACVLSMTCCWAFNLCSSAHHCPTGVQHSARHCIRQLSCVLTPLGMQGMDFTTDKLRALVRKWQTLIESHVDVKTTDGYTLRMFCIGFTKKRPGQVTCGGQHR